LGILVALLLAPLPSMAQTQSQRQTQNEQRPGRVAESAVGEVGQRQTRERPQANIEPMSRINSRIANRVQNRIRNRIDRYYNPQANATSPFEVAADRARDAGSRDRR
jgi:hypothetical protein